MIFSRIVPTLIAFALLTACSANFDAAQSEITTLAFLRTIARADPTDHIVYMGADGTYHYFFHAKLGGGGSYRIPVSEWSPPEGLRAPLLPMDLLQNEQ
jgi:hypothetical protein